MTLNTIHHIAIICSDKDAALHFYHDLLSFPIVCSNFRQGRQDWKIDLKLNDTTELELFIMKDRPARVSNPEAYGLRHVLLRKTTELYHVDIQDSNNSAHFLSIHAAYT